MNLCQKQPDLELVVLNDRIGYCEGLVVEVALEEIAGLVVEEEGFGWVDLEEGEDYWQTFGWFSEL